MNTQSITRSALKLVRLPFYVIGIFTGTKSFRDNPVIGSKLLNVCGLHVARMVMAAAMTKIRFLFLSPMMDKTERQSYAKNGFLLIENFLPQDVFESLNEEVRGMSDVEVRQCVQGDTLTQRVLMNEDVLGSAPMCEQLVNNREFLDRLKYAQARNISPIFYIQKIRNNVSDAAADPQRTLHSDTFHSTMKAWLFLDEVGDHNGPFTYVPGSHKLTLKRLGWEYKKSIKGSTQENSYSSRGSLRVQEDELTDMRLPEPAVLKVPANSLVIADTHGFHRRGAASEKSSRLEIWAYSRTNPFNPMIGFNLAWYNRFSHTVIDSVLKRRDRIAEEKNRRASWHLIDAEEMFEPPSAPEVTVANTETTADDKKVEAA